MEARKIPAYTECLAILRRHQNNERMIAHGKKVAEVGKRLACCLNAAGMKLNIDLVVAGGLLHDIAKGQRNHAGRGEKLMKAQGFETLAAIVGAHMDMDFSAESNLDEAAIVFLADKLVQEDRLVSLADRFRPALAKGSENPAMLAAITRRQRTAEAISSRITELLGISHLEEIALQ